MNRSLRFVLVVSGVFAAACGSHHETQYKRLATEVNPVLNKLRVEVAPLVDRSGAPHSDAELVASCLAAEQDLVALRDVKFLDEPQMSGSAAVDAELAVQSLIEHRPTKCMPDNGDVSRTTRCRDWCRERWNAFADDLERIRKRAAADGVEIVSLRSAS